MDNPQKLQPMKRTKTYNHQGYGHHLLTASLAPTSGTMYLIPIESAGDFCLRTYHYKYTYNLVVPPVPPGGVASFNFYCGLYRMMRGTGGSASTIILISDGPQGSSSQTAFANTSGTEYQPQATASPIFHTAPEGVYFIGMLWVNTSHFPATVSWSAKGVVLPSSADFVYYRAATTGLTALPANDTISTAQVGQIYADMS